MTLRARITGGVVSLAHELYCSCNGLLQLANSPVSRSAEDRATWRRSHEHDQPTLLTTERNLREELARATASIESYSRTPLDFFKLWRDKSFFFSSSQRCVVAFQVANNVAVALGDPVGPADEIESTMRGFLRLCREKGWSSAFYQTLPDFLSFYRGLGLRKLKIGDDAIVDLCAVSLSHKLKRKVRHFQTRGIRVVELPQPLQKDVIAQLKEVSDQWLRIPGRRERSFTVGQFDPDYLRSTPVLAAVNNSGTVLAFINLISVGKTQLTGDLMRRRADAPNGIMDYLFIKLFWYARERGYARVNLGMTPMTGFGEGEQAAVEEHVIHDLFQRLGFLFSFRGLHDYKAKFATSWEPRYLIYGNILELPRIAIALRRLSEPG